MNPEEAMMAFTDLGGQLFIPMHYGAFDMSDEPLGEPIKRLRKCSSNSSNMAQIKELAIGEKLLISEPHQQESVSIPAGKWSQQCFFPGKHTRDRKNLSHVFPSSGTNLINNSILTFKQQELWKFSLRF
jgi:hypothetical protein